MPPCETLTSENKCQSQINDVINIHTYRSMPYSSTLYYANLAKLQTGRGHNVQRAKNDRERGQRWGQRSEVTDLTQSSGKRITEREVGVEVKGQRSQTWRRPTDREWRQRCRWQRPHSVLAWCQVPAAECPAHDQRLADQSASSPAVTWPIMYANKGNVRCLKMNRKTSAWLSLAGAPTTGWLEYNIILNMREVVLHL